MHMSLPILFEPMLQAAGPTGARIGAHELPRVAFFNLNAQTTAFSFSH